MAYRLSRRAIDDIADCYRFGCERFGREAAEAYLEELRACLKLVGENPHMGRLYEEFVRPVRIHHHGRHYVVYRPQNDAAMILRILHDGMDVKRHLSNLRRR
ncbi:MAG: type II toxin-antitoxin system RelE/ParE family toxin [Amphiplicatus sp.]